MVLIVVVQARDARATFENASHFLSARRSRNMLSTRPFYDVQARVARNIRLATLGSARDARKKERSEQVFVNVYYATTYRLARRTQHSPHCARLSAARSRCVLYVTFCRKSQIFFSPSARRSSRHARNIRLAFGSAQCVALAWCHFGFCT